MDSLVGFSSSSRLEWMVGLGHMVFGMGSAEWQMDVCWVDDSLVYGL